MSCWRRGRRSAAHSLGEAIACGPDVPNRRAAHYSGVTGKNSILLRLFHAASLISLQKNCAFLRDRSASDTRAPCHTTHMNLDLTWKALTLNYFFFGKKISSIGELQTELLPNRQRGYITWTSLDLREKMSAVHESENEHPLRSCVFLYQEVKKQRSRHDHEQK